jgi:hypothetical protein
MASRRDHCDASTISHSAIQYITPFADTQQGQQNITTNPVDLLYEHSEMPFSFEPRISDNTANNDDCNNNIDTLDSMLGEATGPLAAESEAKASIKISMRS